MPVPTYRKHFNASTTDDRYAYLELRVNQIAQATGRKYSLMQFASGIVDFWLESGAPSVHPKDKVIPVPRFKPNVPYGGPLRKERNS